MPYRGKSAPACRLFLDTEWVRGSDPLSRTISPANHERDECLSKRQAHKQSAAVATVRRINTGSFATCGPSTRARHICATVTRPKTVPVVMRYAFIGIFFSIQQHVQSTAKEFRNVPQQLFPVSRATQARSRVGSAKSRARLVNFAKTSRVPANSRRLEPGCPLPLLSHPSSRFADAGS